MRNRRPFYGGEDVNMVILTTFLAPPFLRIAFGKTEAVPETLESKDSANPIP